MRYFVWLLAFLAVVPGADASFWKRTGLVIDTGHPEDEVDVDVDVDYRIVTVSDGSIKIKDVDEDGPIVGDWTIEFTFNSPPQTIQTITEDDLKFDIKVTGTATGEGAIRAQFAMLVSGGLQIVTGPDFIPIDATTLDDEGNIKNEGTYKLEAPRPPLIVIGERKFTMTVFSPSNGGIIYEYTLKEGEAPPPPPPTLTVIRPEVVEDTDEEVEIRAHGENFVQGAFVRADGEQLPTTFNSPLGQDFRFGRPCAYAIAQLRVWCNDSTCGHVRSSVWRRSGLGFGAGQAISPR